MLKSATAIIKRFFITCPPSFKNLTTFNFRETFAVPVASSLPISRLLFIINVHSVTCFKCLTVALYFRIILYFILFTIYRVRPRVCEIFVSIGETNHLHPRIIPSIPTIEIKLTVSRLCNLECTGHLLECD